MPGLDANNPDHVYQLKAHIYNLNHVWRRFQIGTDSSLEQVRRTILCLFDLREDFPCVFRVGRARYSGPGIEGGGAEGAANVDFATVPLSGVVEKVKNEKAPNKKNIFFSYESPEYREYARSHGEPAGETEGDDIPGYAHWYIVISYENELPAEEGRSYPACIAGERASPPDAVNNYGRYLWLTNNLKMMGRSRFIKVIGEKGSQDEQKYIPLIESGFDPATFDIDTVNRCLSGPGKKLL
jgi:hypothetical protein